MLRLVVALSAISSALSDTFPKLVEEPWQEAKMSEVANESKNPSEDLLKLLKMAPGYDDEAKKVQVSSTCSGPRCADEKVTYPNYEFEALLSILGNAFLIPVDAKPGLNKRGMGEMRARLASLTFALNPIMNALIQGKKSGCFTAETISNVDQSLEAILTLLTELHTDVNLVELRDWALPK
ncbi:uncharacterized protein LOC129748191 [Uranotaenia lowii]|uniref:uncharacterized protein LOC129748191 n=1 Tax=Uranotaenia lowii TaxID=190385 RepID=UPI002478ED2D|nr:uncharacterized protein LOC129748191 [Uranotaenia lowii]